jgi:two-component system, LytTR family, response regulator
MVQSNSSNKFIGNFFVDTSSIIRCQASSNYTKIFFCNQRSVLIAKTLSLCATAIGDANFIRIHNSHLINKNFVQRIAVNGMVYLKDGTVCTMSRRRKSEIKKILSTA